METDVRIIKKDKIRKEVKEYREKGMTLKSIGKIYGRTHSWVSQLLSTEDYTGNIRIKSFDNFIEKAKKVVGEKGYYTTYNKIPSDMDTKFIRELVKDTELIFPISKKRDNSCEVGLCFIINTARSYNWIYIIGVISTLRIHLGNDIPMVLAIPSGILDKIKLTCANRDFRIGYAKMLNLAFVVIPNEISEYIDEKGFTESEIDQAKAALAEDDNEDVVVVDVDGYAEDELKYKIHPNDNEDTRMDKIVAVANLRHDKKTGKKEIEGLLDMDEMEKVAHEALTNPKHSRLPIKKKKK